MGWAEDHVKQRVLVVKIYDPERESRQILFFFHTLNDRHGDILFLFSFPLYVGGLQTIFVDGPSRSSSTRPFTSPVPRFIAAHPASRRFMFSPFRRLIFSFAVSSRSVVSQNRYDPRRRETNRIQNSLRRLECQEHATRTDQTFIKRDQNVYPPSWPSTKRVCEKNLHVLVVLLGMIETRCVKITGKFDPYTHE